VNFLKQHLKQVPFAVAITLLILGYNITAVVVFGIGLGLAIWHAVEKVKREDP
jgi:hypothetical protein